MGLFSKLNDEELEQTKDILRGSSTFLKDSDIYTGVIKLAYAGKTDKGAQYISLVFLPEGNDSKEYKETIYITSGNDKGGKNWYYSKDKDGKEDKSKKIPLPGFALINDLCIATVEKSLSEMDAEDKVVKVWDNDAKAELAKSVPVLTELTGETVSLAILKKIEDKTAKNIQGQYEPTGEYREFNTIEKVFHTQSKRTISEAKNKSNSEFWDAWLEKNQGTVADKRKKNSNAGKPVSSNITSGKPRASLFSN